MKAKTIKKVLSKKIADWLETIDNETLRKQVAQNTIVTGGCIASMLLGEPVNDFDIYLRDKDTAYKLAEYYCARFNALHPGCGAYVMFEDDRVKVMIDDSGVAGDLPDDHDTDDAPEQECAKHKPVHLSANAITLSGKIQVVVRFYGEPDEIHENYDFVHCTNYYDHRNGALVLHADALECLLARELRYVGSKYPLASIIRTRKFIKRGYSINAGQYLKMALQLNELNLLKPEVLEEQLTGVDLLYFRDIIIAAKERGDISAAYVCEIVDRIF